jgi:hypothetical protein
MPFVKQAFFDEAIKLLLRSLDNIVDGTFSEQVLARNNVERAIELLSGKKLNELQVQV